MIESIEPKKIAVLGDLILDKYTFGETSRISPEAPVPIFEVQREEWRIGGAGNVLANLRALGMDCRLFGRIGKDNHADRVEELIQGIGVSTKDLLRDSKKPTTAKNRIIASNQQLLRLDEEEIKALTDQQTERVLKRLEKSIDDFDALVLSDYGKGFLSDALLKGALQLANRHKKPVVVDPKGSTYVKYKGATVITPNHKEALVASKAHHQDLEALAVDLIQQAKLSFIMITLGKDGIAYFKKSKGELLQERYPVEVQEVTDVTGAGDTVVAVTAMCLANNMPHDFMCELCNSAAGYVVGHFGATSISFDTLLKLYLSR